MLDVHGSVSLYLVNDNAYRLFNDIKSWNPKSSFVILKGQIQHAPFQSKGANSYSIKQLNTVQIYCVYLIDSLRMC